jgi:dienelactone hydrolase
MRWVYAASTLIMIASLLGLRVSASNVEHYSATLEGGVPAVVYEPRWPDGQRPESRRAPVVVLGHGFSASASMMSSLARQMARAGFGVVAIDFHGHGRNSAPLFREIPVGARALSDDLDAAVRYARAHPRFDPRRVAVAGHSMGARAALAYGNAHPDLGAVVALSGAEQDEGTAAVPNLLVIWAAGDSQALRVRAEALAAARAGLPVVQRARTYGDIADRTAIRAVEMPGVDHVTILYSAAAADEIIRWLAVTLGPGTEPSAAGSVAASSAADLPSVVASPTESAIDARLILGLVGLVAAGVACFGLGPALALLIPKVSAASRSPSMVRSLCLLLAALSVGLLVSGGSDPMGSSGPMAFMPLLVGRDALGYLFVSGVALCAVLLARGMLTAEALRDARTWFVAAMLCVLMYFVYGALTQPVLDLWLAPHRVAWAALGAGLALPYFVATEWLFRAPDRARSWGGLWAKLLTLAVLVIGIAVGVLPGFLALAAPLLALLLLTLEVVAMAVARAAPNPWVCALFQAAIVGWTLAAAFALEA